LPGIKFRAWGENIPSASNFTAAVRPGIPLLFAWVRGNHSRGVYPKARDYKATLDLYNKRTAAGEKNLIPPRPRFAGLIISASLKVLEGKRYVHSHCYREDEILMLLRVAKEFRLQGTPPSSHVLEGYKVADEIAAAGAGAVHIVRLVGLQSGG